MLHWLLVFMALHQTGSGIVSQLKNPGFESPVSQIGIVPGWDVSIKKGQESLVSIQADDSEFKEGHRSLSIVAKQPTHVKISQEIFLPVGTTWKVSLQTKGEASDSDQPAHAGGALEVETPAGNQARTSFPVGTFSWTQQSAYFRVPPPGRVRIAIVAFSHSYGRLWLDDVRLEAVTIPADADVQILNSRISDRPINIKQGGQFIESLCHLIPSMLAQQVDSDSFEDEIPCEPSFKRQIDWPYRPWYPDGAVHDAKFSLDTTDPYNGKQSEKIELPLAKARAGISQGGFYTVAGTSYRLHLHMKGIGDVQVWASLRGGGGLIAGPVPLGHSGERWQAAEALLQANKTIQNATLTIEFQGPGTLWLDRIYLIGQNAILGLWRPDVVDALKAMKPGIIRFGGSMIEVYEWEKSIGPWDSRVPYVTGPWGGLDPNFVGIEEFVQLTRFVGAEPLICVRWSGKKPEDASAQVEYLNGDVKTHWGQIRALNGHPEPYRVKFWQIGNEVGGSEYDASVEAFAEAMRKVDPNIKVLSSFPSTQTLSKGGGYLDYLCPHHYECADLQGKKAEFDELENQIVDNARPDVRVAVTEWNTTAEQMGLTRGMLLTLGNALSTSRYQNLLHRYSSLVEIAVRSNLADSFGSGVIQTGPGWLYLSPTYYAQVLYQRAAGTYPIRISRSAETSWDLQEPDLSATMSADGQVLRIYAVNSTAESERVHFHLQGFPIPIAGSKVIALKDREPALDSEAMNSQNDPKRITLTSRAGGINGHDFPFSFSPFSVTLLELRLTNRPSH
jgi:alpha-L-arabinofuranosidase